MVSDAGNAQSATLLLIPWTALIFLASSCVE